MVTVDQVKMGFQKYIEKEVAYKATGLTKFMIYFYMPSLENEVISYINKAKSDPFMKVMFDDNGNVNIDEVYKRASLAMERTGKLYIQKLNLNLDRTDVDKLVQYIKEA